MKRRELIKTMVIAGMTGALVAQLAVIIVMRNRILTLHEIIVEMSRDRYEHMIVEPPPERLLSAKPS